MILEYTSKKAQEIRQQCKTTLDAIKFLENIPESEIIESCSDLPDPLVFYSLKTQRVVREAILLLLYFLTKLGEKSSQAQEISLLLFLDYLFKAIRIESAEKELSLTPWEAYLAHKSCNNILGWNITPPLSCSQQCHIYQVQSEVVEFLTFLSEAEKRSNLLGIWGKAYLACKSAEKDVDPETFAETAQQYAWILYENYFVNPAYGDFPEKANKLFEEAISYRLQNQSTGTDFHNEIGTRFKYFYYLQKLGHISKAEEILHGALEKLESHKDCYASRKSLYYRDYIFCLEAILSIEKYNKEKGKDNSYKSCLSKARAICEALIKEEDIASDLAAQYRSLAEMLLQTDEASSINRESLLEAMMPKEFFQAKEIMNKVLILSTQQTIKLDDIVYSMPPELRRYFMLHDISRRIYRAIFNDYYSNERSTEFFLNTTHFYFKDQREFLYIRENELLWIRDYVLLSLMEDKKDDCEQPIYYSILFLASFGLATLIDPSFRESYLEVLRALYRYFTRQNKYDELRKIFNLLQKLPWYSQQFRTIKSPELLATYSAMLQLETLAYRNEEDKEKFLHLLNISSVWDNLTVNMEIMSNRVRPFPLGHVFYKWQFIVQTIIWIEKCKRDFAGSANRMDLILKHRIQKSKDDTGIEERLGEESRNQLFDQIERSPKPLHFLYNQELETFSHLYHEEGKDRFWYYWMLESPIYPSDFPFQNLSSFSPNLKKALEKLPDFKKNLGETLQTGRTISLSCIAWDYDRPEGTNCKFKLISTIFYSKGEDVKSHNQVTFLTQEDIKGIEDTVSQLRGFAQDKVIKHYQKLYELALAGGAKHLIWIGADFLKFFPIHILPIQSGSPSIWMDIWDTIQFSTSLREIRLPQKVLVPTSKYPTKTVIPVLRLFGEKDNSRGFPALGRKVLEELVTIENSPVIEGLPQNTEAFLNVQEMRLEYMPEVISYYGHIHYGSYLEEPTGFYANGRISHLNEIISSPELGYTKRVELWGCQSATTFIFDSLELPQYEHFAERFFKIGIEQILATIKEIPDLTAALFWEHMSLSEKLKLDNSFPLLLKQAVQWYRKAIVLIRQQVQQSFSRWLEENRSLSPQEITQKQHPFLRKIITDAINQMREEFHKSLPVAFPMKAFTEEDVDQSILSKGDRCHLGRDIINQGKQDTRIENPNKYAENLISRIFCPYEVESAWGSIIFINTAIGTL